eukprot:1250647-Ditylum_brightwellii.AAC.2
MMIQAKKFSHMDDAQYGGQKGREAIEPAVIKILTVEICHLQSSNAAFTDCNEKACYDQIIPAVSALLETKAGCPENVNIFLTRTLKELKYHPTTAKYASELHSKHTEESPWFGTGQGAKDSPRKWTLVDNNILKQHKQWAIGLLMNDPIRKIKAKQCLVKFVDGATLLHNLANTFNLPAEKLMEI